MCPLCPVAGPDRCGRSGPRFAHQVGFPVLIKAAAGGGGRGMGVAANDLVLKSACNRRERKPRRHSAMGAYTSKIHRAATARRSANACRPPRKRGPRLGTRVLDAASASEVDRKKPGSASDATAIRRDVRIGPAAHKTGNYTNPERSSSLSTKTTSSTSSKSTPVSRSSTRSRKWSRASISSTQIRIAAGEPLRFKQEDIVSNGARDRVPHQRRRSDATFSPPGKIERMFVPGGTGVRFDTHAHSGYVVPPHYDSMIGKLIVHQPTRRRDCLHAAGAGSDSAIAGHHVRLFRSTRKSCSMRSSSRDGSTRRSSSGYSSANPAACKWPVPRAERDPDVGCDRLAGKRIAPGPT